MPITHLHSICATVGKAVAYGASDKHEKNERENIEDSIAYAKNDKTGEIVFKTYTSTINCRSDNIEDDFMELIERYNKNQNSKRINGDDKRNPLAWHLVQSFDGFIPPLLANQIGQEFANEFLGEGWRVQVSTHTNTENIHNHIIFCAWNENGKKYNDCHTNTNLMREISDRICESYGIQTLENTRKMKLIKWTDKDGKTHYYEPTDRKNRLIDKRKKGEISLDDISSYRNSESYQEYMRNIKSNKEVVQHDIDMFLPYAISYEHLLSLLRERCNYKISDKKKNGDWREHITFIPPTADKGVRDNSIGDGVFYLRENLEKFIITQEKNRENISSHSEEKTELESKDNGKIPVIEDYSYGTFNVQELDERLRAIRKDNGEVGYLRRGATQKLAVQSVKRKDNELYNALYKIGFNQSAVNDIILREKKRENMSKWQLKREEEQYVRNAINQIQDRLNVLKFMENNSLHTYDELNTTIRSMWEKYNQCFSKVNEAEKGVYKLEGLLKITERLQAVQQRMQEGRTDRDYVVNELANDKQMEKKYLYLIDKYKLNDEGAVNELKRKIERIRNDVDKLSSNMELYKNRLSNYEKCVDVLRECDLENEKAFGDAWKVYDDIERAGKEEETSNSNERKQYKRFER